MIHFLKNRKYPIGVTLTLIAIFFIFQNGTCSQQATLNTQGAYQGNNIVNPTSLTLTGSASSVPPGTSLTFTASGGTPPYYYTTMSGGGTFTSPSTGAFTAPAYNSTCVVQVQDSANSPVATAKLIVDSSLTSAQTGLSLTPLAPTVGLNSSTQFTAAGGTPPYTFTVIGSLGYFSSSGLFVAGSQSGSMQIQVTDSSGLSQVTNVSVGNAGTVGSAYKFVSATASSNNSNSLWAASHLIDGNNSTCYSSGSFGGASVGSGVYVRLQLGDASTGATGSVYKMDHLNITARMKGTTKLAFPLAYTIQFLDSDNSWQTLGTFNTQPGADGMAYLFFSPVYTSEISIIATYLTVDDYNTYYFQMCEVSH